ncbi:MAG TPA: FxsA family protein [Deltaproteobacteria bacterium]|jgi:UPF0716 protein FxsA|nr:FxsA family protein [Deltaproteobacteria bacterium]HOI06840.1 FxsA family protein [Deltaproteobacteria bacterium]
MLFRILLVLILATVGEIYVLVKVGSLIGALNTVAILILMGFAGAYLARLQGRYALARIGDNLRDGRMPPEELVDALLILAAGILLLLPGFISDLAALILLVPPARELVKKPIMDRIRLWIMTHRVHINYRP